MSAQTKGRGGIGFLHRARNSVASGFSYRPPWFDAAVQYQPAEIPKAHTKNVQPIEYPEDRLLEVLAKKHPELWTNTVINLVPDEMGRVSYVHPASAFVERQKLWMSRGQTEEEAYQSVLQDWKRQQRFERIELQVAMLQAAQQRGVDVPLVTEWEHRYTEHFQTALQKRVNKEQQKRRERLESLLEARDAAGEKELVDLTTLDPDVGQADLDTLLLADPRAQAHFGGDGNSFSIEIERLLPKKGEPHFEQFRDFLDEQLKLAPEVKEALEKDPLDSSRAQYFKILDETVNKKKREEQAALLQMQLQAKKKEEAAIDKAEGPKGKAKPKPSASQGKGKGGGGGKSASKK